MYVSVWVYVYVCVRECMRKLSSLSSPPSGPTDNDRGGRLDTFVIDSNVSVLSRPTPRDLLSILGPGFTNRLTCPCVLGPFEPGTKRDSIVSSPSSLCPYSQREKVLPLPPTILQDSKLLKTTRVGMCVCVYVCVWRRSWPGVTQQPVRSQLWPLTVKVHVNKDKDRYNSQTGSISWSPPTSIVAPRTPISQDLKSPGPVPLERGPYIPPQGSPEWTRDLKT